MAAKRKNYGEATLDARRSFEYAVSHICLALCLGAGVYLYKEGSDSAGVWEICEKYTPYKLSRNNYGNGKDDYYVFAVACVAFMSLRHILRFILWDPLCKLKNLDNESRYAVHAHGWVFSSHLILFSWGLSLYFRSPYNGDFIQIWRNYPNHELSLEMKLYYMLHMAHFAVMLFVQTCDKWQQDFHLNVAHHLVTLALVDRSYFYTFHRTGHLIMTEQDFADIFIPLAKLGKRLKWPVVPDILFAVFAVVWFATRHGILPYVQYLILTVLHDEFSVNCPEYNPDTGCYYDAFWTFLSFNILLGLFQILMILWGIQIAKAVWTTITAGSAKAMKEQESFDKKKRN